MKKIADLFGNIRKPPVKVRRSERHDLIDFFLEKVNPPRIRDGFKPYSAATLNYFLSHVRTPDLYALRSKCEDAVRSGFPFDAIFWKEIKEKTKPSTRHKFLRRA